MVVNKTTNYHLHYVLMQDNCINNHENSYKNSEH